MNWELNIVDGIVTLIINKPHPFVTAYMQTKMREAHFSIHVNGITYQFKSMTLEATTLIVKFSSGFIDESEN
jgi:hypothetical protein